MYTYKNNKMREYYPFFIFGLVFFIAQCFVNLYPGDDTYFIQTVKKSKNVIEFVIMRYETWSGRVASEFFISIFSLMNLWIWRILNTLVAVSFIICISNIIKVSIVEENSYKNTVINSFVCLSFFIIPISVTTRSCSWFTGSFNYLWPTFLCFVGMSPFIYKIYNKNVTKLHFIISILSVLYASYMEQTGAVLICFGIITLLYLYKRDHRFYLSLFIENLIILLNLIISNLSPGTALRKIAETKKWYPEFDNLSLFQKLYQGVSWTHSHLVRESTFIMVIISLFLFIIFIKNKHKLLLNIISFIPSLYFMGSLIPFNKLALSTTSYEYNYDIEKILGKLFFNPMSGILPSSISSIIVFSIIILLCICIKNKNERYLCVILYLASLACGYILGLSPTIFASGPRIFFVTNMLLIIVSGILLKNILEEVTINGMLWRISYIIYCILSGMYALIYVGGIAVKTIFKID